MASITNYLALASLGFAAIALTMLLYFLFKKPRVGRGVKILLFFAIGLFPLTAAVLGNIANFQVSKQQQFCASCHTMTPFTQDALNPSSKTLAALHSRNAQFGSESCYVCHKDYRLFGTLTTKLAGLRDLWSYYTKFIWMEEREARKHVRLLKEFPLSNCTQCHSMNVPIWQARAEHSEFRKAKPGDGASCLDCHGPAHPAGRSP